MTLKIVHSASLLRTRQLGKEYGSKNGATSKPTPICSSYCVPIETGATLLTKYGLRAFSENARMVVTSHDIHNPWC